MADQCSFCLLSTKVSLTCPTATVLVFFFFTSSLNSLQQNSYFWNKNCLQRKTGWWKRHPHFHPCFQHVSSQFSFVLPTLKTGLVWWLVFLLMDLSFPPRECTAGMSRHVALFPVLKHSTVIFLPADWSWFCNQIWLRRKLFLLVMTAGVLLVN